jgi:hypothetical protein
MTSRKTQIHKAAAVALIVSGVLLLLPLADYSVAIIYYKMTMTTNWPAPAYSVMAVIGILNIYCGGVLFKRANADPKNSK